ncbi:MAG: HAD family hydrolase [Myxococcaceae bacterium]
MGLPFDAVIFDLDGTLVNSIADLADAMNHALSLQGQPPHDEAAYRLMVGEGVELLGRRALPEGKGELLPKLLADFRARYAQRFAEKTRPYPGVAELVKELLGQGCKVAVLSNKREEFTRAVVAALFPGVRFDEVRGEREAVPRKPDPTAALELAREFEVAPGRCALVGDTSVDMDTARRAGMLPVGALWGYRSREELLAHGAKVLLAHPGELLGLGGG